MHGVPAEVHAAQNNLTGCSKDEVQQVGNFSLRNRDMHKGETGRTTTE